MHRQQWRNSLRDHAASLRDVAINAVSTNDVVEALQPIWLTKRETASRVRGRIEKILAAAKARDLRPRDSMNPATWRGHLDVLLPKQSKLSRGHHAALPWQDAPAAGATSSARGGCTPTTCWGRCPSRPPERQFPASSFPAAWHHRAVWRLRLRRRPGCAP